MDGSDVFPLELLRTYLTRKHPDITNTQMTLAFWSVCKNAAIARKDNKDDATTRATNPGEVVLSGTKGVTTFGDDDLGTTTMLAAPLRVTSPIPSRFASTFTSAYTSLCPSPDWSRPTSGIRRGGEDRGEEEGGGSSDLSARMVTSKKNAASFRDVPYRFSDDNDDDEEVLIQMIKSAKASKSTSKQTSR
jgi:hypothetical protein